MQKWTFDNYNEDNFIDDYNRLYHRLSSERKRKVDEAKTNQRKAEELMAGSLLEEMLYEEIGGHINLEYDYSDRGKPFLVGSDLYFSLSHTRNVVACAVANQMVGIDVERRGRYNELVVKRYFTEQEYELLIDDDEIRMDIIFTVLWTAKEAVAKCVDIPVAEVCKKYDMSHLFDELFLGVDVMKQELEVIDWDNKKHRIVIQSEIYDDFAISVATEVL